MANEFVRKEAREKGVHLWEIAAELGISDVAFSKQLRFEFDRRKVDRIVGIIDDVATRKAMEDPGNES